jgi:hypothetical protein
MGEREGEREGGRQVGRKEKLREKEWSEKELSEEGRMKKRNR